MRITDAAQRYVDNGGALKTNASKVRFMQAIRHLSSLTPGLELEDYTSHELTRYCIGDGIAPATQRTRRALIRPFFEWCEWMSYIPSNPASSLKFTVKPGKFSVRSHTWLTSAEALKLLTVLGELGPRGHRDRLVCGLGLLCGLRKSEIAAVTWKAFTADRASLRVTGKGQKMEEIGVPAQLRGWLDEWAAWAAEHGGAGGAVLPRFIPARIGESVLVPAWNTPLMPGSIPLIVKQAGTRIGYPDLATHDLRRSFAGILEQNGVAVQDISRAMRHENVAITSTYLERRPGRSIAITEGLVLR